MKKYLILFLSFTLPLMAYGPGNFHNPDNSGMRNAPPYAGKPGMRGRRNMRMPDIQNLISEVRKISPYVADEMEKIPSKYSGINGMLVRSLNRAYLWYNKLKDDAEGADFADDFWKLSVLEKEYALKIRDTKNNSEIKKLKKKLEKTVSKLFDLRQRAREIKIRRAEENLKKIKAELKERMKNRKQIIKDHINLLLGHRVNMSW